MPTFKAVLARLVRENATISIEATTIEEAKAKAQAVYDNDEADTWEPDFEWGAEEGTHHIVTPECAVVPFSEVADKED